MRYSDGMRRSLLLTALACAVAVSGAGHAKETPPTGRIIASCGQQVVLVNPADGTSTALETGPVGWLYPAPGGLLFAPDTVNGATTVINLRSQRIARRLEGVTLPVFGEAADRYAVAVPGRVLVVSFPDRVVLLECKVDLERPWRTRLSADDLFLYVLERPLSGGPSRMTVVDLLRETVAVRSDLAGDAVDMVLLENLGLVAVAVPESGKVELRSGSSLAPEGEIDCGGTPTAIVYDGARMLVVAETRGDRGRLERWKLGRGRKGLTARLKDSLELPGRPVRLALDPTHRWLSAAEESGAVWIVPTDLDAVQRTVPLPSPPRDVVWPDPSRPGPLLPEWSDRGPAQWAKPDSRPD